MYSFYIFFLKYKNGIKKNIHIFNGIKNDYTRIDAKWQAILLVSSIFEKITDLFTE